MYFTEDQNAAFFFDSNTKTSILIYADYGTLVFDAYEEIENNLALHYGFEFYPNSDFSYKVTDFLNKITETCELIETRETTEVNTPDIVFNNKSKALELTFYAPFNKEKCKTLKVIITKVGNEETSEAWATTLIDQDPEKGDIGHSCVFFGCIPVKEVNPLQDGQLYKEAHNEHK